MSGLELLRDAVAALDVARPDAGGEADSGCRWRARRPPPRSRTEARSGPARRPPLARSWRRCRRRENRRLVEEPVRRIRAPRVLRRRRHAAPSLARAARPSGATRSSCGAFAIGPICVASSIGSPSTMPCRAVVNAIEQFVVDSRCEERARAGDARLPAGAEDAGQHARLGRFEVGVVKDDVRALARRARAMTAPSRLPTCAAAIRPPVVAAGEGDLRDPGVIDECSPRLAHRR